MEEVWPKADQGISSHHNYMADEAHSSTSQRNFQSMNDVDESGYLVDHKGLDSYNSDVLKVKNLHFVDGVQEIIEAQTITFKDCDTFAETITVQNYDARDGGMGMNNAEMEHAEIRRKLEFQVKPKLELAHGVHIQMDAINLACQIVERCPAAFCYSDRGENCNAREVVGLQQKATELLEEACLRVRQNVDKNLDEHRLDKAEYLLYRSLVELKEVRKEKDHASRIWIPLVESEYKGSIDTWESLLGKLKTSVVSSEERARQVASPKVGIPASWLCNSWKPQLQGLSERLMKSVAVQRRAVIGIANALSRSRSNPSDPIGSLLFLCTFDDCGEEIVKALAEQLFDSKDHLIGFDLRSVYPDESDFHPRPFSVLRLDNIDKAYSYMTQCLHEIIRHGRLTDHEGNTVDLSKTLVVMTSDVGKKKYLPPFCACLEMHRDVPFKNELFVPDRMHSCSYRPVLREARMYLGSTLYDEVDDVIMLKKLNVQEFNAVARLQLRNVSSTLDQKGLILYPTEAALLSIEKKLAFKKEFVSFVDFLMSEAFDVHSLRKDYKLVESQCPYHPLFLVPTMSLNEATQKHEETSNARARNWAMLDSLSQLQGRPHQPARSFLYLGLTSVGKQELANGLAEINATSDWAETAIKINLRECCESNSFFQQMDKNFGPSSYRQGMVTITFLVFRHLNYERHGFFPPRILLFDEVEKAPMPIFRALISLLDYGTLGENRYQMYDFSSTIVVIMSHLENKEVLASLVGGASTADLCGEGSEEVRSPFRTELLTRVDEIVMCNPCAAQQLSKISRLPMMSGQHLEDGPPSAVPVSFFHLFERDQTLFKRWPCILKDTVSQLSKGLMRDRNGGTVVSLACKSLSIPPSSFPVASACGTLLLAAGAATEVEGAVKSCATIGKPTEHEINAPGCDHT
ncbi:hypothetical protein RJ639_007602 [Escallonia herrerae]|uniref:ATPase AAA-type core domain-containing protein n=1 Tax=Escallonia herrerae TaxID=1293975 RepID=A0AA89AUK8_9ASTE|nr:hypothetical protein RJ639_007602 [Escallonia herrerae]